MTNLIKAECYKLVRSRSFWGMLIASIILGNILLLDHSQSASALDIFYKSLYNTPILSFLILIFGALFVGEDFETRAIQGYVTGGHKRTSILFAKTVVYLSACIVILFAPLVVHGLAGTIIYHGEGGSLGGIPLLDIVVIFFAIIAMGIVSLLISFLFKDVGKSMAVSLVLFFIMIFVLNSDQSGIAMMVLPMGQLRMIAIHEITISYVGMIVTDILWTICLSVGAWFGFRHSDLK